MFIHRRKIKRCNDHTLEGGAAMAAIQRMTTMATSISLFSRGYVCFLAKLTPSTHSSSSSSFKVFFSSSSPPGPGRRRGLTREIGALSKLDSNKTDFCTSAVGTVASDVEEDTKSEDSSKKVVLPTNHSSESLLRVRHTVSIIFTLFPDLDIRSLYVE